LVNQSWRVKLSYAAVSSQLKGLIKYQNGAVNWPEINIFLIGIKCRLVADLNEISEKIAKIDTCMKSIDSCPKTP
ncbi:MAG: hypothetical protein ACTJGW_08145, partial [Vibrio casei]